MAAVVSCVVMVVRGGACGLVFFTVHSVTAVLYFSMHSFGWVEWVTVQLRGGSMEALSLSWPASSTTSCRARELLSDEVKD